MTDRGWAADRGRAVGRSGAADRGGAGGRSGAADRGGAGGRSTGRRARLSYSDRAQPPHLDPEQQQDDGDEQAGHAEAPGTARRFTAL
ncbi:hypothetical protein [Streptomyces sp. NPDC001068]|uniref:hypothetical protein n=1 Tax=Streptomyces sp. NPDC001068 TaxID=3364544 RepID=UPI00369DD7D2